MENLDIQGFCIAISLQMFYKSVANSIIYIMIYKNLAKSFGSWQNNIIRFHDHVK